MDHIQAAVELWSRLVEFVRYHVPPERWPNATLWSALAVPIGLMLALWGARILRITFILGFMAIGGYLGMSIAQHDRVKVDVLIGLVLGAGLTGVLGHLFFRWWLGLSAAAVAILIVLLSSAPQLAAEVQTFKDYQTGVTTGNYLLQQPQPEMTLLQQAQQYTNEMKSYLWEKRPELVRRLAILLSLAGLLGLAVGVLMPRLTMIIATSVIGVLFFAAGLGVLLSTWWQPAWATLVAHTGWSLAACGVLLLIAISYQARSPRAVTITASPAALTT